MRYVKLHPRLMRAVGSYWINRRTGEVHRWDCPYFPVLNGEPLGQFASLRAAVDISRQIDAEADACGHCRRYVLTMGLRALFS